MEEDKEGLINGLYASLALFFKLLMMEVGGVVLNWLRQLRNEAKKIKY